MLTDPLFTVERGDGVERLSLAELLAHLLVIDGGVHRLLRVTAEQAGPFWRVLVRCAVEALRVLERLVPPPGADVRALAADIARVLAERAGELNAWRLHEPDVGKAAFLQPPFPGGGRLPDRDYKLATMARLSLALGGKHHERKADRERTLDAEALAYALITFQSGVIYTKGNYAAPLMGSASGKGSGTPYIGARLTGMLDATFRHDVTVMLGAWETIRRERGLRGTVWALWTVPWNGETPIEVDKLDPAFIPCARLVRVGAPDPDGRWSSLWYRSTKKARVDDVTDGSGLGDPFLPLVDHPKKPGQRKVRGTMGTGYRYDEVVRLLLDGPSPSVAALLDAPPPEDARIRLEGMAFDQGKTLGFHHREILVPHGNYLDLSPESDVRKLHGIFLRIVKDAQSALRAAARILLLGSPKPNRHAAAKTEAGAQTLQWAVDAVYVEWLFTAAVALREESEDRTDDWRAWVRETALRIFAETRSAVPTQTTTRLRREIWAEAYLLRALAAPQSDVPPDSDPDDHDEAESA